MQSTNPHRRVHSCQGVASCLVVACSVAFLASAPGRGDDPTPQRIRVVAFSPDGKLLAASMSEPKKPGMVALWDITTQKTCWTHREKTGISSMDFAPDGQSLAIAVLDRAAKLLDVANGKEQATLIHPAQVRAVAHSPDGKLLATASLDKLIRVWDLASKTQKVTCTAHRDWIASLHFSPDGKLLLSAAGEDGAKLWDAATGTEKRAWAAPRYANCAIFTNDGRWVVTGGVGPVHVWNVETGAERARFDHLGDLVDLAYSAKTRVLAQCNSHGFSWSIQLRDLNLDEPSADELKRIRLLLAKLDDDSIEVRETTCKDLLKVGFVAEPELRRAMKEAASAEVRIRARKVRQDLLTQPQMVLRGNTEQVECLAFAPDGKLLATGGKDGTVRLWDVATGKESARWVLE